MIRFFVVKTVCPFEQSIICDYIKEMKALLGSSDTEHLNCIQLQEELGQSECAIRIIVPKDSSCDSDDLLVGESIIRDVYHIKMYYGTVAAKGQSIIRVYIEPFYNSRGIEEHYDKFLENLKVNTKNILLKKWKPAHCTWLYDQQSIDLATSLYTPINNTENALRALISQVMIARLGPAWWEKIEFVKLKNKYLQRKTEYARAVPSFRNVEDFLMALNADDLTMILEMTLKKWNPIFEDSIDLAIKSRNEKQLLSLLEGQLVPTLSLWDEVFSKYLSEEFKKDWVEFCKNRNHVAHNKLIDFSLFCEFKKTISAVNKVLKVALNDFDKNLILDEDYLEDFDEPEPDETIEERLGYDFYRESAIRNMFIEHIEQYVELICDELSVRQDIVVKNENINIDVSQEVLSVTSKIDSGKITMRIRDLDIDDSSGGVSSITVEILEDGTFVESKILSITNSEVHFDFEKGYEVLEVDAEVNLPEVYEVVEWFLEILEAVFIPPAQKFNDLIRFFRLDDGESPFGAFGCSECGEEMVVINESAGNPGRCIYCGAENEITECLRCGEKMIGTEPDFCENCREFIDEQ